MWADLTNQLAGALEVQRGLEDSVALILIITALVEVISWDSGRRGRGERWGLWQMCCLITMRITKQTSIPSPWTLGCSRFKSMFHSFINSVNNGPVPVMCPRSWEYSDQDTFPALRELAF